MANGSTTTSLTLTHDALGHLTGATGTGATGSWAYANMGDNLTSASSGGASTSYSYSPANPNQLLSSATGGVTSYYGYDQSGHLTSISPNATNTCPSDAGSTCLSYDAAGRLSTVTRADGLSVTMAYDAMGLRSSYTASGAGNNVSEHFQYRGGRLAQVTTSGASAYTDTFVYRQDGTPLELLRVTAGPGTCGATTCRYWYETDGRGNVIALTDGSGNVVDRYSYDLWGKPLSASETVPQRLRYAGYWYDSETGWYWLRVRHYDPVLERFLQPDPSGQEGLFSYAYVDGDPVDATDPSGLLTCYVRFPHPDPKNGHTSETEDCSSAFSEDVPEGDTVTPLTPANQGQSFQLSGALPLVGAALFGFGVVAAGPEILAATGGIELGTIAGETAADVLATRLAAAKAGSQAEYGLYEYLTKRGVNIVQFGQKYSQRFGPYGNGDVDLGTRSAIFEVKQLKDPTKVLDPSTNPYNEQFNSLVNNPYGNIIQVRPGQYNSKRPVILYLPGLTEAMARANAEGILELATRGIYVAGSKKQALALYDYFYVPF